MLSAEIYKIKWRGLPDLSLNCTVIRMGSKIQAKYSVFAKKYISHNSSDVKFPEFDNCKERSEFSVEI